MHASVHVVGGGSASVSAFWVDDVTHAATETFGRFDIPCGLSDKTRFSRVSPDLFMYHS